MSAPNSNAAEVGRLTPADFNALGDPAVRRLLALFVPLTHAHEIAVWVKDPAADRLVAVLDTSGPGGGFEMKTSQSLASGIVSRVYREQAAFLERGLWRSRERSPEVDAALQQVTQNEMVVPFRFADLLVGVMSAVQLTDRKHATPKRWGFDENDLAILAAAAEAVAQSLERALLLRRPATA